MKPLTKTVYKKFITGNAEPVIQRVIVHTQTSCGLIEKELCTIYGENAEEIADIIIAQHNSLIKAESFISGFENDDTQDGIIEILSNIRKFNLIIETA